MSFSTWVSLNSKENIITPDDLTKLLEQVGGEKTLKVALNILNGYETEWPPKVISWDKDFTVLKDNLINLDRTIKVDTLRAIILIQCYMATKERKNSQVDFENFFKLLPELGNDKQITLTAIKQNSHLMERVSKKLKNDKEFVLEAVRLGGYALKYVPEIFKEDKEVVLKAVQRYSEAFQFASHKLKANKVFVLDVIKSGSSKLKYFTDTLKKDKDVVFKSIHACWDFMYAADELKADKEFILDLVRIEYGVLEYASDKLKEDEEFILSAFQINFLTFKYASDKLKENKDFVLALVKLNYKVLKYASYKLKENKDFVLELVKLKNYKVFKYVPDKFKDDKEFVLKAVQLDGNAIKYLSEKLQDDQDDEEVVLNPFQQINLLPELGNDKRIVLAAIKQNPRLMKSVSEKLQNDKEFVLEAIQLNFCVLKYVPVIFKEDKEVVLKTVQVHPNAFLFASDKLKADKVFVLDVIKSGGFVLQHVTDTLKKDKDVVFQAVRNNYFEFVYASDKLKADEEFVLDLVKIRYEVLEYASDKLKDDKEFILRAFESNFLTFEYASDNLKEDKDFVLKLVILNYNVLEYVSDKLKEDKDFALELVKFLVLVKLKHEKGFEYFPAYTVLKYVPDKLKDDKEFVLKAVQHYGDFLHYVNEKFMDNKEIVLKAVQQNVKSLRFASEKLKEDEEVVLNAILQPQPLAWLTGLQLASKKLRDRKELILKAVQQAGDALEFASEKLKDDKEVVLMAVQQNGKSLKYASEKLKGDKQIVLRAVQQDPKSLEYASEKLKEDREVVLSAVLQKNMAYMTFRSASWRLKDDKEVVLQVVKHCGLALHYASCKMQNDKEVVLQAIKEHRYALEYVGKEVLEDQEVALVAIQRDYPFKNLSEKLRNDKELILKAAQQINYSIDIDFKRFHAKGKEYLTYGKYKEAIEELTIATLSYHADKEVYSDRKTAFEALSQTEKSKCLIDVVTKAGNLRDCGVTNSDMDTIVDTLMKGIDQANNGILLDLRFNQLTNKSAKKLIELVAKNPFIWRMWCGDNVFSYEESQEVYKSLEINAACYPILLKGKRTYEIGDFHEAVSIFLKASNHSLHHSWSHQRIFSLHHPFICRTLIDALNQCQRSFPSTHQQSIAALLPLSKVWRSPEIRTLISLSHTLMVSGHDDGTIVVWDIPTRKPIESFYNAHKKAITHLFSVPGSKTEFLSFDGLTLERWDMSKQGYNLWGSTNKKVGPIDVKDATAIEFHSDGSLVLGDGKGYLKFVDPIKQVEIKEKEINTGYSKPIRAIKSLSETLLVIGYDDGTLIHYDLISKSSKDITEYSKKSKIELKDLRGMPRPIIALIRFDLLHWVSGSEDGVIKVWNNQNKCIDQFEADAILTYLDVDSTGKISIGCRDGTLHLWRPLLEEKTPKANKEDIVEYRIKEKLKEEKLLGSGTFGHVYEVGEKAMKVLKKGGLSSLQDIESEKEVMWRMRGYPTVMSLDSFFENDEEVQLVMERMPDGALVKLLEKQGENDFKLCWEDKYDLMISLVYGVLSLHVNDIVHRDINTANIFINMKEKMAKIGDLGTSRFNINRHKGTHQKAGTFAYLDPWFLCAQERDDKPTEIKRYTKKCDIYSLGVVLWELLNENYEKPWFNFDFGYSHIIEDVIIKEKYGKENSRLQIPKSFPSTLQKLLPRMWEEERNKRPNIVEIYEILLGVKNEFIEKDKK